MAELYAPLKQTVLDAILNLLKQLELYAFNAGDALRALGIIDTPRTAAAQLSYVQKELAQVNKEIDYFNDGGDEGRPTRASRSPRSGRSIRTAAAAHPQRDALQKQLSWRSSSRGPRASRARCRRSASPAARNPPVAGGGKTDQDNIDAQIRRYKALAEAAAETGRTIDAFHATNIEDFQREVKVQQQVDEIAAKLGTRYSQASAGEQEGAARSDQRCTSRRRAPTSSASTRAQKAADIERKYGDGTAQAAKTRHDLDLAEKTNIATKTALARATKVQQEADEQARLEGQALQRRSRLAGGRLRARRQRLRARERSLQSGRPGVQRRDRRDGRGARRAAPASRARRSARSPPTSRSMLAKMALQAATSPVFKWVFGALGGIGSATAAPAGYGIDCSARRLHRLLRHGGARAAGGPVYPGSSYLVGENGPERFVPTVAGTIQPMRARRQQRRRHRQRRHGPDAGRARSQRRRSSSAGASRPPWST